MAETQQTMTEFTFAPGEKNIIGDRFSPSVIIFWLKTSIAASSTGKTGMARASGPIAKALHAIWGADSRMPIGKSYSEPYLSEA